MLRLLLALLGGSSPKTEPLAPARVLVPFKQDQPPAWGYMDERGRVRIPARFGAAGRFAEGRALVQVGETASVIDSTGAVIFATGGQWSVETWFACGRIAIWEERQGRWAYQMYDRDGRHVFAFDGPRPEFREGLAAFGDRQGRYGYVDIDGKIAIAAKLSRADVFSEGLAAADVPSGTSPSAGYIDKSGAFVIKKRFHGPGRFSEGLAYVSDSCIDTQGKRVFRVPDGWRPNPFSEGLSLIEDWSSGNRWFGFVDKTGRWVLPPRFSIANSFKDGLAVARTDGAYGYIDRSGAFVIAPQFSIAGDFDEGLARVSIAVGPGPVARYTRLRTGVIDKTGAWLREWEDLQPPPSLQ